MHCPFCQAKDTGVVDSRLTTEGDQIRRRRECCNCKMRFTTYEKAEITFPFVVKSNEQRQPFEPEKLRIAFEKALHKRPVSVEQLESTISKINKRMLEYGEREIPSRQIGEWVMENLRMLDDVAYIRFASVYRRFEHPQAFIDEVSRMKDSILSKQEVPKYPVSRKNKKK